KWADSSQMEAILRQGINAKTNQTLLTVVKAGQLQLAGVISEKDLDQIHVGSEGTAKPTAAPKSELGVTVAKISDVPISDGKFGITLDLNALPEDLDLVPGMSCEVTFAPADDKS
ncbi:MAG: hypothetical protein AAGF97_19350, partial [Planctomycetota bacterium]